MQWIWRDKFRGGGALGVTNRVALLPDGHTCRVTGGDLLSGDDVAAVEWVRRANLRSLQITEGTLSAIERAFEKRRERGSAAGRSGYFAAADIACCGIPTDGTTSSSGNSPCDQTNSSGSRVLLIRYWTSDSFMGVFNPISGFCGCQRTSPQMEHRCSAALICCSRSGRPTRDRSTTMMRAPGVNPNSRGSTQIG